MSSLVINGDTSGSITLAAPAVAGSNTLTLPTLTGTVLTNKTAGVVLQVVNATYSTNVSSSTNTFVDTGLTATITPTSATSKILVSVSQNGLQKRVNSDAYHKIIVLRGSTVIGTPAVTASYNGSTQVNYVGSVSGDYLDSPATTSPTVYKTQFCAFGNSASVQVQGDSEQSTITLMEIAA